MWTAQQQLLPLALQGAPGNQDGADEDEPVVANAQRHSEEEESEGAQERGDDVEEVGGCLLALLAPVRPVLLLLEPHIGGDGRERVGPA